jgi:hypothetical protein
MDKGFYPPLFGFLCLESYLLFSSILLLLPPLVEAGLIFRKRKRKKDRLFLSPKKILYLFIINRV